QTLGNDVIPEEYRLVLKPNLAAFTFEGTEEIDVKLAKSTHIIRMNAKELKISKAEIVAKGKVYDAVCSEDARDEQIMLRINGSIAGKATIRISFTGMNNDKMYGFYRSKYRNERTGKDEYMLTTQFEAADARAAFPCFDEPSFKAAFKLTLVIDKELDAVSNMPAEKTVSEGAKKTITFNTTPRMSTYLLYIGVGRFEYLAGKLGSLPVRVITVPGKKRYARLALSLTKKFVAFYEKYFGVKYPLPKLDMIAIPDFAAGAMENWGAITFREVALLCDEKTVSISTMQNIADTIAHELAHQWFGDLVTMKWWNDLWLNESFATYMSYKAVDAVFPKWGMYVQSFLETNATAFGADQLRSTHPISVKVDTPADIDQIFDEISYEKGGSILKMIEDYAGYSIFRDGLHSYLKKHAYGNATKYDLWDAINATASKRKAGLRVKQVAQAWIDKPGYPVLELSLAADGKTLSARQKRFALLGINSKDIWPIPIHYIDAEGEHFKLSTRESVDIQVHGSYAKLNYGQKGFYRVKYPGRMLAALGGAIKQHRLHSLDAWGIENDLYALLAARHIGIDEYLSFVKDYCGNAEYPLNYSIGSHLLSLFRLFYYTDIVEKIRGTAIDYYNKIIGKVGMEKKPAEPNITTLVRGGALTGLGLMEPNGSVSKYMKKLFAERQRGKSVDPNLSGIAYMVSAWTGNEETFNSILDMYAKEKMPDEQRKLLGSLGFFRDEKLLKRALDFSLGKKVRMQDSFIVNARMASNPAGAQVIWYWTKLKWNVLKKRYDSGTHMLSRYVNALASTGNFEQEREIRKFFAARGNMRNDVRRALRQTLEIIEINAKLVEHATKAH
ncbi:MAG: M1 family metallopeptidase, partial [Candidatus Micrarchaeaceae archaeon]